MRDWTNYSRRKSSAQALKPLCTPAKFKRRLRLYKLSLRFYKRKLRFYKRRLRLNFVGYLERFSGGLRGFSLRARWDFPADSGFLNNLPCQTAIYPAA